MKVNYRNGGKAKLYAALKAYAEGGQVDPPYKKGADGKYRDENGNEVSVKPEATLSQAEIEDRGITTLGTVAETEWQEHPNYQKLWAATLLDFSRTEGKQPPYKTNPKGYIEYQERLSNLFERRIADLYATNPYPDSPEVQKLLRAYEDKIPGGMVNNPNTLQRTVDFVNKKYGNTNMDGTMSPYWRMDYNDVDGVTGAIVKHYTTNQAFTAPTPGDEGMPGSNVKLSGW